MKIIVFLSSLVAAYAVAVPGPAPDENYPRAILLADDPSELAAGLYSRSELTSNPINLEKRADPPAMVFNTPGVNLKPPAKVVGVLLCFEKNFVPPCIIIKSNPYQCVPAPSPSLRLEINAIRPDKPYKCRVYDLPKCVESKGAYNITYPGIADFTKTKFTNQIESFRCS